MMALTILCLWTTPKRIHKANRFSFAAMGEVAALFLGIFITMQGPIEFLRIQGPALGLVKPWQYFWASGALSSFLDNAPTYLTFSALARGVTGVPNAAGLMSQHVVPALGVAPAAFLAVISCGSVFMGANSYIGNAPNFMVKSIAEEHGVDMPHFFHYMAWSGAVLLPIFAIVTLIFYR